MKSIKQLFNKLFNERGAKKQKKEYYFRVYRWMAKMPISGYEKMVYAYIYGYNYHERGFCYVAEQLGGGVFGVSAETMNSIMNKLIENGYLFKDAQGLFWCDKFLKNKGGKK
jgi:hypothetical protein